MIFLPTCVSGDYYIYDVCPKRSNLLCPKPTIHRCIARLARCASLCKLKIQVKKVKVPSLCKLKIQVKKVKVPSLCKLKIQVKKVKVPNVTTLTKLPSPAEFPTPIELPLPAEITLSTLTTLKHLMLLQERELYDHDFGPWLERKRVHTNPLALFKLYGTNKKYHFVKDWVKKHIRSLLCFLYDVIHVGHCVSSESIAEENMVLVNNVIKFKKLKLKRFDVLEANSTFKTLGKFITDAFFKDCDSSQIPEDMSRLVWLLGQSPCTCENLIKNHISLMTDRAISCFICSWHNLRQQHTPSQRVAYKAACKCLPHSKSWKSLIKGNDPFLVTLSKSKYKGDVRDLPRFIRNCLQHLISCCFRGRNGMTTTKQNFDDRDVVKMVVTVFHESITKFPELLDTYGLLSLSRPEECFH